MFTPTKAWIKAYQQQMLEIVENERRAKESRPKAQKPEIQAEADHNIIVLSLGAGIHTPSPTKPHTTL